MTSVVDIVGMAARITHEVIRARHIERGEPTPPMWDNCSLTYRKDIEGLVRALLQDPKQAVNYDLYMVSVVGALLAALMPERTLH